MLYTSIMRYTYGVIFLHRNNIIVLNTLHQYKQHYMDLSTPHTAPRWVGFCLLMLLFVLRIYLAKVG